MRPLALLVPTSLLCLAVACSSTAPPELVEVSSITPQARLASLDWLEGRWVGDSPRGRWESVYTAAEGGLVLGMSKEFVGGEARAFEFEKFLVRGGEVVVIPAPNGVDSVAFKLVDHDPHERRAVFVNPDHDFPTRITYERDGGRLVIRVETPETADGQAVGFTLELERAD